MESTKKRKKSEGKVVFFFFDLICFALLFEVIEEFQFFQAVNDRYGKQEGRERFKSAQYVGS